MRKWLCGWLVAALLLACAAPAMAQDVLVDAWAYVDQEGERPYMPGCWVSLADENVQAVMRGRGAQVFMPAAAPQGYVLRAGQVHLAHAEQTPGAALLQAAMDAADMTWQADGYGRVTAHFQVPARLLEGFARATFALDADGSGHPRDGITVYTFISTPDAANYEAREAAKALLGLEQGREGVQMPTETPGGLVLAQEKTSGEGDMAIRGYVAVFMARDAARLARGEKGGPEVSTALVSTMDDEAARWVAENLEGTP